MSWTQWPGGQPAPAVAAAPPPLINPAPTVVPPGLPYSTTDQWSQMQQQNWQQWAQWQQQYQQWHQQYGAEYQKSMNALAAQQPVVHNLAVPPPLPIEPQPPLPQDELPKPAPPLPAAVAAPPQPPMPQYSTQPPPSNNFSAPPPNFTANPIQGWRSIDVANSDQKRPLGNAEESPAKRQMMNRPGWKGPINTPGQTTQNFQVPNHSNLEELSQAEKKFDKQFAEWEAQFNKWKDQNSGHPDKQQYKEYEKKWEQWRQQLLERREAMRKKRLGLTGANKAPPNQNFNIPPPTQGQAPANVQASHPMIPPTIHQQKQPSAPAGPLKEPLLPTPDIFSKPPPNMNDEPLQFKKSEGEQEPQEGSLGFLSASKSDGIPGLDLVKDGELEPEEENSEQVTQKGPDLEAISKGIKNILGDQKLMSMLSMVSQTQNVSQNSNINTMSKINEQLPPVDQSNLSTDESPNERFTQSETVQNFDDQTRSSFTMQPNDPEFYRVPPPGNQFNRGGFQGNFDIEPPPFNRGPLLNDRFDNRQFSGPGDDDFRRPPPNRFGRGIDNAVDSDQNRGALMNRNSGNFGRGPVGHMGRDDFNSKGPGLLGPGRSNSFSSSGPGALNREPFGIGGMDRDISGPGNMNRGLLDQDGLHRDPSFPGGMYRERSGPGSLNRGPEGMTREPPGSIDRNRAILGTGGMNRDSLGPEGKNKGTFGQESMSREPFGQKSFSKDSFGPGGMMRDSFESIGMNRDSFGPPGMNRDVLGPGGDALGRGSMNRDSLGFGGMNRNPLGSGDMNKNSLGTRGMNRDSLGPERDSSIPGGMFRDAFAPGSMNKGPNSQQSNINRDKFGPARNRDDFGPSGQGNLVPEIRDDFRQNRQRFEPVGGDNMDRDKFEPHVSNLEDRSQLGRHAMDIGRDDFVSKRSDAKFGHQGGPNPGDRRNSRYDDIDYGDNGPRDNMRFDEDIFPPNRRPSDGPSGRRGDFGGPLGNFNHRRDDFEQMPIGMRANEGPGFRMDRSTQDRENFVHRDGVDDEFEPRGFGSSFNKGDSGNFDDRDELHPDEMGYRLGPRNFGNDRGQNFRDGFHENFRDEEDDYPPPPPLFGQLDTNDKGSLHNPLLDAPEPPQFNRGAFDNERFVEDHYSQDGQGNDFPEEMAPLEQALEDLWKPVKVIDYDHKSLKEPEMDILLEPFRMFDYRHKPLDRIPFPERPNWLSDAVRMIPEFDPPLIRAPTIERRIYEDRFEPSPFRRDDRYDPSRMDDRYRDERRVYHRFSPPPPRGKDHEDWSSSRGNRSRSPLRFEKPSHVVDKMDRGGRNRSRERGRDWEPKGRIREGGSRDWDTGKEDWKGGSKDWNSKDEHRDRGDREDYRDRGNRDDHRDRVDRDDHRDRADRDNNRDRGGRDNPRDRGERDDHRDRGERDDHRDRGDRDDHRDRGDRDDHRDRGDRDDHRDRGRDWKGLSNKEDNWKNKNKEWEERGRQWEEESVEMDEKARSREREVRFRNARNIDGDFDRNDYNRRTGGEIFPLIKPIEEKKASNVTMIEDLINPPGRSNRPPRIVIILRGPPGSGKTYLAKLIKDKEVENGGSAPRILSLDDYFMVEQEKEVMEDGKRIKTKDMVYEFEAEMEESYRTSLMRSFKKTITDGYFSFIIVDNVNDKVKHFGEMWSFAKQNGFQVYISQLDLDVQNCTKRNVHNRTEDDIRKCVDGWEDTPAHHPVLDVSFLTQEEPISEVEMEEINSPGSDANDDGSEVRGRSEARLDGVNKPLRTSRTMEEYLQLDDDWQPAKPSKPGQKRVRWADLEERKQQEKMRAIGFVVGQTDWDRMMDPTLGESALTQTKYIEKTQKRRF